MTVFSHHHCDNSLGNLGDCQQACMFWEIILTTNVIEWVFHFSVR